MFLVPLRRAITQSNLSAAKHPLHNCTVLKGLILRSQAGQSSTISGSEASSHAAGPSHSFTSEAGGSRGPAHQSSHTSADASTGPGSANSNSGRGFGGPADGLHRSRGKGFFFMCLFSQVWACTDTSRVHTRQPCNLVPFHAVPLKLAARQQKLTSRGGGGDCLWREIMVWAMMSNAYTLRWRKPLWIHM